MTPLAGDSRSGPLLQRVESNLHCWGHRNEELVVLIPNSRTLPPMPRQNGRLGLVRPGRIMRAFSETRKSRRWRLKKHWQFGKRVAHLQTLLRRVEKEGWRLGRALVSECKWAGGDASNSICTRYARLAVVWSSGCSFHTLNQQFNRATEGRER